MQIAVVIPALHEADRIEQAALSARAPGVEVLVVDGGSRDATLPRALAAGARVLVSEPGRARQLDAGVRATSGEGLVFLHADCRLPAGFAAAVRSALADPEVAGGAFRFRFEGEPGAGRLARLGLRVVEAGVAVRVALLGLPYGDQALFARRSALERAGGIPQVPILEDLDLVAALRRTGRFVALPGCVRSSPRRYLTQGVARTWLRNAGALLAWRLGLDRARIAAWYGR
jgi:rSAM/selenodomain-associated transferase 2